MDADSRTVTADHLLDLKSVSDAQIDPSGARVAFVVAESFVAYREPSATSRIWMSGGDGGTPIPITRGPGCDDLPRWSPDGTMLAFRSDRDKRGVGQPYLLRGSWQEAAPLHAFPDGITALHWSPDGRAIAVIVPDKARDDANDRPEGDDRVLFEEEHPFGRIWLIDVASGDARCVTRGALHVWEMTWAPNGREIAAVVSDLPYGWSWYHARLASVAIEDGNIRTLYAPQRQIARPAWSPDGSAIAVISSTWSDPGMTGGDLFLVPATGGEARNLTAARPISHLSAHWRTDGHTLYTAALERNRAAVCEVGIDGELDIRWRAERAFASSGMSVSADGRVLAAAIAGPTEPAELWVGRIAASGGRDMQWQPRSAVNAGFPAALAPVETITWHAADGTAIEGLLIRPRQSHDGPAPLVVMIHGGPTSSWPYGIRGGGLGGVVHLLAARGIAVLMPNPRGSTGWGLTFAEANHRDMGGEDLADILAGTDYCVRAGIADAERLGVGGWSYGGYLTAWAITQTTRFKAAVAGASITNWYSFHGGTDRHGFDEVFFGADPYALDGPYASRSPIFLVDSVRTPTLFLHGEKDACCPVGQAYEMARALRARGVETQCVVYPREPHGIREREHQRDLIARSVAWFADRLGVAT